MFKRFAASGPGWPPPIELDDAALEARLYPHPVAASTVPLPDFAVLQLELRRKGVTRQPQWHRRTIKLGVVLLGGGRFCEPRQSRNDGPDVDMDPVRHRSRPMTVYILNSMTIHDRAEYDRYLKSFMPVFRKFNGMVLAAQDRPVAVEGEWPYDRTILLSFPSREDAQRWIDSPEYQGIVAHRHAGTRSNVVMLDGLLQRAAGPA